MRRITLSILFSICILFNENRNIQAELIKFDAHQFEMTDVLAVVQKPNGEVSVDADSSSPSSSGKTTLPKKGLSIDCNNKLCQMQEYALVRKPSFHCFDF